MMLLHSRASTHSTLSSFVFFDSKKKERRYRARIELTEDGSGFAWKDRDHDRSREKQKGNAGEKRGKKSKPRLPPPKGVGRIPEWRCLKSPLPHYKFFFTSAVFSRVTSPSPPAPFLSSSITKGALVSNWAMSVVRLCSIIAPYGRTK